MGPMGLIVAYLFLYGEGCCTQPHNMQFISPTILVFKHWIHFTPFDLLSRILQHSNTIRSFIIHSYSLAS